MIAPVLQGVLAGLIISSLIGPVFFMLIDTAMNRGTSPALALDIGILTSDACWIGLFAFGWGAALTGFMQSNWANLVGGVIFIGFGIISVIKKPKYSTTTKTESKLFRNFVKGFFVNFLNPAVPLFWLASVLFVASKFEDHDNSVIAFFVAALLTVFLADLLKIAGARKVRKFMTYRNRFYLSRIMGVILVGFGIVLLGRFLL
jgi:threonine/homoserine/homoserine lactone efflux protein